jgi:hypothetical protein
MLSAVGPIEGPELLLNQLSKLPDNQTFLESLNRDVA